MPITEAMSVPTSSSAINFDQFKHQISNSRPRRRRCSTWNHTSTIPIEESEDGANAEHLVKGEALVCVSKDGSTLMVSEILDSVSICSLSVSIFAKYLIFTGKCSQPKLRWRYL